jgi:hypothetical protein
MTNSSTSWQHCSELEASWQLMLSPLILRY